MEMAEIVTNEASITIYSYLGCHSFFQQILIANLLIDIVLGVGDILANKTDKRFCTHGVSILLRETIINNINK